MDPKKPRKPGIFYGQPLEDLTGTHRELFNKTHRYTETEAFLSELGNVERLTRASTRTILGKEETSVDNSVQEETNDQNIESNGTEDDQRRDDDATELEMTTGTHGDDPGAPDDPTENEGRQTEGGRDVSRRTWQCDQLFHKGQPRTARYSRNAEECISMSMDTATPNRQRRMERPQGGQEGGNGNHLRCRLCRSPEVDRRQKKLKSYVVNKILKVSIDYSELWFQVNWSVGGTGWIREDNFIDDGAHLLQTFMEQNKEKIDTLRLIIHEFTTHGTKTFLKGRSSCKKCMLHDQKICLKDAHDHCAYSNCNCGGCKEVDFNDRRAKKKMAMLGKRKSMKAKARKMGNRQAEHGQDDQAADNDEEQNENEEPNDLGAESDDDDENREEGEEDREQSKVNHQLQNETVENIVPPPQLASDEENVNTETRSSTAAHPSQTPEENLENDVEKAPVTQNDDSSTSNVATDANEDDGLQLGISYAEFLENQLFPSKTLSFSIVDESRVKQRLKNWKAMSDSLAPAATVTGASSNRPWIAQQTLTIDNTSSVSKLVSPALPEHQDDQECPSESQTSSAMENQDHSRSSVVSTASLAERQDRKRMLPNSSALTGSHDQENPEGDEGASRKKAKWDPIELLVHVFQLFKTPEKLTTELRILSEEEKRHVLQMPDANNDTLLHLAIKMNKPAVVNILLSNDAPLNLKNSNHQTPLQMAFGLAATDILQDLLMKGADFSEIASGIFGKEEIYLSACDRRILEHDEKLQTLLQEDRLKNLKRFTEFCPLIAPMCHPSCNGNEVSFNFKFFGEGRKRGEYYLLCIHTVVFKEQNLEIVGGLKVLETELNGEFLEKTRKTGEMDCFYCRPLRDNVEKDNVLRITFEQERCSDFVLVAQLIKVRHA